MSCLSIIFPSFIPLVFIWSTPFLSKIGFCYNGTSELIGHSLSRFISTPQATGMMAVSFYSLANIMVSKKLLKIFDKNSMYNNQHYTTFSNNNDNLKKNIYIFTGLIYESFFGLFLCAPVIYIPKIHFISVIGFSMAAYIHMILLEMSPNIDIKYKKTLKILKNTGTFSLLGMAFCNLFVFYNKKIKYSYLFWIFECTGLSSMILFMNIVNYSLHLDLDVFYT